MALNNINLLCTRPVEDTMVSEARDAGISITQLSFIETEPIKSAEVQQQIEQAMLQQITVVFTSMNAVEAVAEYLEMNEPDWLIYCMGNTTQQLVKKYFGEDHIAGIASNATELAAAIVADRFADEVIFFCGDQRRDELPQILYNRGIDIKEITVYQTIPLHHAVAEVYEGILFFSPSAVESFFNKNKVAAHTVFFAIGNTTATTIKKYSTNKIVTGIEPGKDELVKTAIKYFSESAMLNG